MAQERGQGGGYGGRGGAPGGGGGKPGSGGGKSSGRDDGTRGPVGTGNSGAATKGPNAGPIGPAAEKSLGRRISDIFGGPAAYARNPHRAGVGSAVVPSIPNPSVAQVLGGIMGAIPGGPIGVGQTVVGSVLSGLGNKYGPYNGVQSAFDKAIGSTPGEIEGYTGSGRVNDQGDPMGGKPGNGLLGLSSQVQTPATAPMTTPASAPQSPLNFANVPSQYRPIGGRFPYGVNLPSWSYQYR